MINSVIGLIKSVIGRNCVLMLTNARKTMERDHVLTFVLIKKEHINACAKKVFNWLETDTLVLTLMNAAQTSVNKDV